MGTISLDSPFHEPKPLLVHLEAFSLWPVTIPSFLQLCSKQVQSVQVTQDQLSLENLLVEDILQVFKFLDFSDQPDSIFNQIFFFQLCSCPNFRNQDL